MTLPNNQPPTPAIPFAITGTGSTTNGSGTTAADLAGRTQDVITELLKETEILGSTAWNAASGAVFAGLDASLGLPLAIVAKAVDEVGVLIEDAAGSTASALGGLLGLIGDAASVPGELLSLIFGTQASQQAQITSAASGGFTYDPAVNGVTGWSNLVGTLALSSMGPYIQAPTEAVAYRASGLSVDKYGVNFVISPSMQGVAGAGICADAAGASWVGLLAYRGFNSDALWLVTAASPTLWVIQKAAALSGASRMSGSTTLDLKTDGVSTFSVQINGAPVTALNWTDSGAIATHNSSHRGVILMTNGLNRNQTGYYGPAFAGKMVSYAA